MAAANALFAQADVNNDQQLSLNEFQNLAGAGGGYGSSYQASSYESSTNGGLGGAGYGAAGGAGYGGSSYESSSYESSVGNGGGQLALGGGAAGFSASDLAAANYSSSSQTTAVQQYATDAQGLFKDSNPQIIRRPAPGGGVTYTQNIRVRFLQPPPVPPPGVSFLWLFFLSLVSQYYLYYSHSSSEKCGHLNHQYHLHFVFANKLLLSLNHLHLSYVNDHQFHQLPLLLKLVKNRKRKFSICID